MLFIATALFSGTAHAESTNRATTDSISSEGHHESIFNAKSIPLSGSHFTWGADLGSSIDLSGNDQSSFDADIVFGYKNNFFRLIGVGVGIHRAFGNGDNFIPAYFIIRTSFRKKPSPLFMNFRIGYSFNTISDSPTYGDISSSIGLGINLAMSSKFKSHIILAYAFRHFSKNHKNAFQLKEQNVNLAQITFGITL